MTTPQQAQEMLNLIEQTEQRSARYLGYWRRGAAVQLWGLIWMIAYLASWQVPQKTGLIWLAGDALGAAGTIYLSRNQPGHAAAGSSRRMVWAGCIVFGLGLVASALIGPNGRAIGVFWVCLAMAGYMLYGLWHGPRWTILGAVVTLICLAAYTVLAPWYNLIMAFAGGGALLLGGAWMRHAR